MSSVTIGGDTSGSVTLQAPAVAGSTVITLPSTSMMLGAGSLLNIQYFTTAGAFTYTATAGTNSVIVEVVGGGGGTTGAGGTSSFGAFCSATGGATSGAGGTGSGGDLNRTCPAAPRNTFYQTAVGSSTIVQTGSPGLLLGFGAGSSTDTTVSQNTGGTSIGCGGGGYSRERITSGFNGTTVTVGALGSGNGSGAAGTAGCVIVYEYV